LNEKQDPLYNLPGSPYNLHNFLLLITQKQNRLPNEYRKSSSCYTSWQAGCL